MKKHLFVLAYATLLCCMAICTSVSAGKVSYGINGGISIPQGDGSEYWNLGYSINGGAAYQLTPYISIAARAAFNHWTLDEDELIDGPVTGASGNLTILEFVPAVQIYPLRNEDQTVKTFLQGGFGVYYLDYEVSTIWFDPIYSHTYYPETDSDYATKVGTSFGFGVQYSMTRSISVELLSQYHIIFTEDDTTKYITVTAGLWF